MAINKINSRSIQDTTVTTADIQDNAITNAKVSPSASIAQSKVTGLSTSISNINSSVSTANTNITALDGKIGSATLNIGLLGFKMAVNDGLTVFNLIDGVVDEFHDESGTDEAEGSNDLYCASSDYYINSTQPGGVSACVSAGFTTSAITEPDTSLTGTNPAGGSGTFGQFTVPSGVSALTLKAWGAGGSRFAAVGGGGGFTTGTLAVTGGQVLEVVVGEAGSPGSGNNGTNAACTYEALGGGGGAEISVFQGNLGAGGGGLSGIFTNSEGFAALQRNAPKAPQVFMVAGGGGGGGHSGQPLGGAGGGLCGQNATQANGQGGTGGSQTAGGTSYAPCATTANASGFLEGADSGKNPRPSSPQVSNGAGGSGFYGGGGGGPQSYGERTGSGGGGSSYFGHPQITSGSTEAGNYFEGGGVADPAYVSATNEGSQPTGCGGHPDPAGQDGYVLLNASLPATTTSTTVTSEAFASGTVPTTSRIVVFEENVATPTLNTDIIASISRDGGTTFTAATLADSGYVTGSSGQRILTGQATISGQPSGQSMRWKLALANNAVKIHGVSLQWS
jgi:hypothetical protein